MPKRESGWYRVKTEPTDVWDGIARYYAHRDEWLYAGSELTYKDSGFYDIDPKMVMTPEGELVYHKQE